MIQCHSLWIPPPCPMIPHPWKPEFLTLCPTDIWGQVMRCVGGCPVHCRILSSTLVSTHHLPTVIPSPVASTKNYCQMFPGGQNHPWLRTTGVSNLRVTLRCVLLKENLIYVNLQKTQARRGLFYAQFARKKPILHSELYPGQSHEKTIALTSVYCFNVC